MAELARDFSYEMELAFFVVEIGISITEYDRLTEKQKMFIKKAHENKFLKDTTWLRNAVLNAVSNALRKKGKKFLELFLKKTRKADKDYNDNAITNILEMEEQKGKGWVDRVYRANGMKKPSTKERG